MPGWRAESNGNLQLMWGSLDEFIAWLNTTVAPASQNYGYRIIIEPIPREEVAVDRA